MTAPTAWGLSTVLRQRTKGALAIPLSLAIIKSVSPVPELSFLPAPYRGWTRAGEKRVQDNLHAHTQNEPIKNNKADVDKSSYLLSSTCRAIPFSARALKKKKFFGVDIEVKNKLICVLSWSVFLSTTTARHYSFPKHFFVLFLCFERKVWRVQVAHLHNAARALSSLSRCFQLSTNLDRDFFRYLWYCGKKQIECRLAWHWWNSTDLGLCIFYHSECKNCCLYIIIQKIAQQAESETCFQLCFFPRFGGKSGDVLMSMRMQVILDFLFARPGSAAIWGGKKGEFRDWAKWIHEIHKLTKQSFLC